jgi:C-terminal peptidase prc
VPLEDRPVVEAVGSEGNGGVSVRFRASTNPDVAAAQRALVEAWSYASQFYLDHDAVSGPAWKQALGTALDASFTDGGSAAAADTAGDVMLASLGDPYTRRLRPGADATSYVAGAEGEGVAVGVQLAGGADGGPLRVAAVVPGSPAAAAGLAPGDTMLAVGGRPTAGRPPDDVARALTRHTSVRVVKAGAPPTSPPVDLDLKAAPIELHAVQYARLPVAASDAAAAAPPVAYVRVAAFNRLAPADVEAAVRALFAASPRPAALLLDLRDNAGGAVDAGLDVLTRGLLPAGRRAFFGSVVAADGAAEAVTLTGAARGLPTTPPPRLAVLVNGGTASTAELVAAALRGEKGAAGGGAVLVGERTFGKGRTQRAIPLSDGSLLLVSNLRYVAPDGAVVDGHGLTPGVACAPERVERDFFVGGDGGGGGDDGALAAGLLDDPCVRVAAEAVGARLKSGGGGGV